MNNTPYVNIARYHAYVACIECRLNYLKMQRDYHNFMKSVYPYIALLYSNNRANQTLWEEKEKDMWLFSWDIQDNYFNYLKGKNIFGPTAETTLKSICRNQADKYGMANFETIKTAATSLFELDGNPCTLINRVDALSDKGEISINPKEFQQTVFLLSKLNNVHKFFQSIVKRFASSDLEKQSKNPQHDPRVYYPYPVYSSIIAWTSHLGSSFILLYEGNAEEGGKQYSHGNDHLYRALLDMYKLILNNLLRENGNITNAVNLVDKDFWKNMILTRKQDHDNEERKTVIAGYENLVFELKDKLKM